MKNAKFNEPRHRRSARRRGYLASMRAWIAGILGSGVVLLAGCGGNSDGELAEYEGSWRITSDTSRPSDFHLTCSTLMFDDQFPFFTEMVLEAGTVSDIYESAGPGNCKFGFNTVPKMKALSIANPDPFTAMAPSCIVPLGSATDPTNNHIVETQFAITPINWVFNLQPSVEGKPPRAQFVTHAQVIISDVDLSATPPVALGSATCNYDILENLDKVAKR